MTTAIVDSSDTKARKVCVNLELTRTAVAEEWMIEALLREGLEGIDAPEIVDETRAYLCQIYGPEPVTVEQAEQTIAHFSAGYMQACARYKKA